MVKTTEKKKLNPVLWFLFAILLPLIIVIAITIFALSLANISVLDWVAEKGSNVPIVSSVIKTKDEKVTEQKLAESDLKIAEQKEQLSELNAEITSLKLENEDLTQLLAIEKEKISKIEENVNTESSPLITDEDIDDMAVAVASFRKMEPKNAARIVEDLNRDSAALILSELSGKVRGAILAEMEPAIAADITEIILDN